MNEKIKELAVRAGVWKVQPPHFTNTNNPIDFPVSVNAGLETFAELLIRECADVVKDINKEYDGGSTVVNASDEIKQYFDIE